MEHVKGLYLENKTPKQRFKIKLLSDIAFAYLHQLDIRAHKYLINYENVQKPAIFAMWHGYQWGLGVIPPEDRKKIHILISLSNDGEMIARVCHLLGFSLIRGSHQREGEKALREIIATLKSGENVAFMVDGPIGPRQKIKKGITRIAKMSGFPIVPIIPYTTDKVEFNSWDKYQVPINLFANGSMIFGKPFYVPAEATQEEEKQIRLEIERYMFDLEKEVIQKHKEHWSKKNG